MTHNDPRSLTGEAQAALRRKAVNAVLEGMSKTQAAEVFGVTRMSIHTWLKRHASEGEAAFTPAKRGRPSAPRFTAAQARKAVGLIVGHCPDQLRLPFALWTREAVVELLSKKFHETISVWTAGRYLKAWGLTPQKPARRAIEQDPVAVRAWLNRQYPAIAAKARRERAEIHWGDESGLRSDHAVGRTYGLKGQTPVVPVTGQRFGCNMISTLTNRGRLAFMVFKGSFNTKVFLIFLRRLIRQSPRKVFLIVDRHRVHRSRAVACWLAQHADRITLFLLPSYSPHLNPDELLNQDVKSNGLGRQRATTAPELVSNLRSFLRRRQRQPQVVRNYFKGEHVRYAA